MYLDSLSSNMKFLNPMATKNDINELSEAIKIYWKWNVVLFKHHWVKLIFPFWQSLLCLLLLAVIFYIIHANYYEWHEEVYWSLAIFYMATTVIWVWFVIFCIFKNIWRLLDRKNMYYEDVESLSAWRKWYDVFSIWSGIVLLLHLLFIIFNIHIPFVNGFNNQWEVAAPMAILFLDFLFLGDIITIMDKLLMYEMSFYICTPDSIKLFKQTWFLSVGVSEIAPTAINIIKFDKDWLFPLLFHYWDMFIYTDSEVQTESGKVIALEDIPEPEIIVKRINKLYDKVFSAGK